jgi:hypothetical protein
VGEGVKGGVVAHFAELVDGPVLGFVGVEAGVEVASRILVEGPVVSMFQIAMSMACSTATIALIGPRRLAMRRYFAAK